MSSSKRKTDQKNTRDKVPAINRGNRTGAVILAASLSAVMMAALFAGCGSTAASSSAAAGDTAGTGITSGIQAGTQSTTAAAQIVPESEDRSGSPEVSDSHIVSDGSGPYANTDYSTPVNYASKQEGVAYGTLDDRVTYYSSTIGEDKQCGVLLPAGYSSDRQYPVVYLLHGFGGDHFDFNRGDSAVQDIYGNLVAAGKAVPAIVVMPDMYTAPAATKETASGEETRAAYDNLVNDLRDDLMPYIASHYSVKTGRENTAIIGMSQGGTESLAIGFALQDRIGYICTMAPCPGVIPTEFYQGSFWNTPILQDFTIEDPDNAPIYLQMLVGSEDPWCLNSTLYYEQVLTQESIDHAYYMLDGVGHEDAVWGNGMYTFFERIFQGV